MTTRGDDSTHTEAVRVGTGQWHGVDADHGQEAADRRAVDARWREGLARAASRAYEAAHGNAVPDERRGARWQVSPRAAASLAAVVALLGLLGWGLTRATVASEPEPQPTLSVAGLAAEPVDLVVHVAGAVAAPGLVSVPAGSRLAEAIEAAGGALEGADLDAVNLARTVTDGERILVPSVGEAQDASSVVNLNTADAVALERLPGVGPVLAAAIVADREAHGPFHSIDDLDRVSGVGAATLERLRPLVTV